MEGASRLDHLACARCRTRHDADAVQTTCTKCQGPLYAIYDIEGAKQDFNPLTFGSRPSAMWRYAELMPVSRPENVVTLWEGSSPMLHAARLGDELGLTSLLVKDEGQNPTGTFKARGMSAAVSRAKELGIQRFAVPTAGNAGGALALYAASAGAKAFVAMPKTAPLANQVEVRLAGAELELVDGTISDAAARVRERVKDGSWFDVSTLKEPYRLEGKKTMGLEIAEALGWTLPDVVVYPTGGGTGLLGIWKAFDELELLGLVGSRRPRMVAVQAEGCAPVHKAWLAKEPSCIAWANPSTLASGLRVPKPFADQEILAVIRASRGRVETASDPEILQAGKRLASREGIFACPEGAATMVAIQRLKQEGWIEPKESVVALNTGSGTKYVDAYASTT